jgi:hypothetical protein
MFDRESLAVVLSQQLQQILGHVFGSSVHMQRTRLFGHINDATGPHAHRKFLALRYAEDNAQTVFLNLVREQNMY